MKPPKFRYHAPSSQEEALDLLNAYGDEAVVLSGGQSLIPMLNLRLARPAEVIDLGCVGGLDSIAAEPDTVSVGARVTHRQMEADPYIARHLPMAREAAGFIGFRAIRNRGTVGGSVAHADPSAEWPVVLLALDGSVELRSKSGARWVGGDDFFQTVFTTGRRADELVVSVRFASRFADDWGFSEFQRRTGDFAVVVAAVACAAGSGGIGEARVALAGVADRPVRCPEAEEALIATEDPQAVAEVARDAFDPVGDSHGSTAHRKQLVYAQVLRAAGQALARRDGRRPDG